MYWRRLEETIWIWIKMGQLPGLICVCVWTKYLPLMSIGSVTHVQRSGLNFNVVNVDSPQFEALVTLGVCLVFLPFLFLKKTTCCVLFFSFSFWSWLRQRQPGSGCPTSKRFHSECATQCTDTALVWRIPVPSSMAIILCNRCDLRGGEHLKHAHRAFCLLITAQTKSNKWVILGRFYAEQGSLALEICVDSCCTLEEELLTLSQSKK